MAETLYISAASEPAGSNGDEMSYALDEFPSGLACSLAPVRHFLFGQACTARHPGFGSERHGPETIERGEAMLINLYIDEHTEAIFAPAVRNYTDLLLTRFLPIFDDVEGEQERAMANALAHNRWHEDEASAMEAAYDEGISSALMLMEMRTVFIATGVAGLFHLFEKQLYRYLNQELRRFHLTRRVRKQDVPLVIASWSDADAVIREFPRVLRSWGDGGTLIDAIASPGLAELREVANAVKHGPGRAMDALHAMNAAVVDPARIEGDFTTGQFSSFGLAIAIQPSDVIRYRDAVLAFWGVRGNFGLPEAETPP